MNFPEPFIERVSQTWGDVGRRWLSELPRRIDDVADRWRLSDIEPFENLTHHYVAKVQRGPRRMVLKLGVPRPGLAQEVAALSAFPDAAAVRCLRFDPERGAILLERLEPGVPLEAHWTPETDAESTRILAGLMNRFPAAPISGVGFPRVLDWLAAIRENPVPMQQEALRLIEAIDSDALDVRLLHGDLHHGNVLSHRGAHAMIDPKGVLGPSAFEAYALFHNPVGASEAQLVKLLPSRLEIVTRATGRTAPEIARWSFLGLILSMAWDVQDHAPPSTATESVAAALLSHFPLPA